MNTPVTKGADSARTEGTAKFIRGVGTAELVIGFLLIVILVIFQEFAMKRSFPADVPFWTSLTSPAVLRFLRLSWTVFLAFFFLIWHGALCMRLQRPLRPIGFAVGMLVVLRFIFSVILFVALRLQMSSITISGNGNTVNLEALAGGYIDFIIGALVVLVLLAGSLAAFCASQKTKRALELSDPARYQLDTIPSLYSREARFLSSSLMAS